LLPLLPLRCSCNSHCNSHCNSQKQRSQLLMSWPNPTLVFALVGSRTLASPFVLIFTFAFFLFLLTSWPLLHFFILIFIRVPLGLCCIFCILIWFRTFASPRLWLGLTLPLLLRRLQQQRKRAKPRQKGLGLGQLKSKWEGSKWKLTSDLCFWLLQRKGKRGSGGSKWRPEAKANKNKTWSSKAKE
jgi:hypothetical protein